MESNKHKSSARYIHNLNIAVEAVFANKFRSLLTALGIIFGVAAVIAMLAIGNGARQEILEQMKVVGVNNIIIKPLLPEGDDKDQLNQKSGFSPGLTLADANAISQIVPTAQKVCPESVYQTFVLKDGIRKPTKVSGIGHDYFEVFNLHLSQGGMFTKEQEDNGETVCIIGSMVKNTLFGNKQPIGQEIKCGNTWLTVIGVIEDRKVNENASQNLGITEFNNNVYVPVQTLLLRFQDRSVVSGTDIERNRNNEGDNNKEEKQKPNYHQLDRIVVQVIDSEHLVSTSKVLEKMMKRRHNEVEDFEVIVPELLLKQEQRTKDIFNIVLGAIAGISLLVGGIGIMNIMLASVMERTKEIGVRLAIGATKKDVVFQFLSESTFISVFGGIIGIILGVALSSIIKHFFDILTIVSIASVVVSFGVSAGVGILFGYMPARKASDKDPVESLRYE